MNDGVSYASPVKIGDPMTGESVGEIIESKSKYYNIVDFVCVNKGWQSHIVTHDTGISLFKLPKTNIPISYFLGAAGMPGRTAYFGLNKIGKPKKNETIVISAASGAVGSIVGQLAKNQV
jgi:NADPH-dependent curcumin reductase CurA